MCWRLTCVDVADKKLDEELEGIEKSVASIFLGFSSELAVEKLEMPEASDSELIETNKSAGPSVSSVESDLGPKIELLWSFQCPMTKGYNVTSIDWNKSNRVRLASDISVAAAEAELGGMWDISRFTSAMGCTVAFCAVLSSIVILTYHAY